MSTKKLQILDNLIKQAENADTLDGKHADEFAAASDVETLKTKVDNIQDNAYDDTAVKNLISANTSNIAALEGLVGDTKVATQIDNAIDAIDYPVDSVNGKTGAVVLSASDVGALPADTAIPSIAGLATETYVDGKIEAVNTELDTKVDKVSGKGLSTNDYTTTEKNKLAGIASGANKTVVDSALSSSSTNPVQNKVVNEAISSLNTLVGDEPVSDQITTAIANKSDTGHTHDDRYYTESEINSKLSGKSDTGHTHAASDIASGTLSSDRLPVVPATKGGTGQTSLMDSANTLMNSLGAGDTNPTDDSCLIAQGVGDYSNKYYRKPFSLLWNYIKGKANSVYAALSHTHKVADITDLTATATELNYVDGVTSNIQTQLNAKVPTSRTVNGKVLSSNITLTASDVGADASGSASSALSNAKEYTDSEIAEWVGDETVSAQIGTAIANKSDVGHTHSEYVNQNAFSKVTVGSTTIAADSATDTLTLAAGNNITLTPDASGDKVTIAATDTIYTHPSSGVTAGTYKSVTVNAQGHVTAGSNPTTLSGYGITDAAAKSHSHNAATTSAAGFMSKDDKVALDKVVGLVGDTSVAEQIEDAIESKSDVGHTHTAAQVGADPSGSAANALTSAKSYTDTKIADLINSAPTTLDTLGEIATAMEDNADVVAALEESVGTKANASDLTSHTSNKSNPHGVTLSQLGVTATAAELNYVDGVTSKVQTQLNAKVPTSRTVNGKALSANITLSASDVGADASGAANTALTNAKAYTDAEITEWVGDKTVSEQISTAIASKSDSSHTHDDRYYTESEINTKLSGKSDTSHTHSAYVNQNAFSNVVVGSTTIAADSTTDTLTLAAGSNITLTPDASGDKVTIAAKDTVYTHPNSGVTAGTYKSVTVNAQGHVTGGSNPTTLSGYGITDAATKTELNAVSALVGDTSVSEQIDEVFDGAITGLSVSGKTITYNKGDGTTGTITTQDTTYSAAGSSLGLVKSGGDVTISSGVITVKDDSHNHTIANVDNLQTTLDGKANKSQGVYYIEGTGSTAGTWLGSHDDITEYYEGLMIAYKIGVAGASTTTLNINSLGAVTVVKNVTTAISTSYAVNSIVFLTYTTDSNGTSYWKVADYDANTKTTTNTTNLTGTKLFLAGGKTQGSSVTTYSNSGVYVGTDNCLYSNGAKVATAAEVDAVSDLIGDASVSEQISDAFDGAITGLSVSGKTITYTKGDGSTGTITTQDTNTTYSAATTSAAGLMSASDKSKLDGIAAGANAYTHPSYTARTGVPTANQTPAFGGTFSVSQPVSDATGHITAVNSRTITIPSATATTSAAGLMSAADKTKLDGIATGANKITVDSALSSTSTNPVQNKAVNTAISNLNTLVGDQKVSEQINTAIAAKAPTSHASTATTYGVSSASNYGHAMASSTTPKANGTAAVGSETAKFARGDHIHPLQTTVSGNAGSATKLAASKTIDGVSFDGSANITHFGTCSTAAATVAKTVALTGFTLATGARVLIKFTVTNTAASPTLNVNSTGAKAIMYRGSAISKGYLAANRVYEFVYDGTDWELIGDINTNTTYSAATQSAQGLMSAADKTKLDGIASGANNYTYTLPTASSSTLGGVKIGSGVTISSGVISVTASGIGAAPTSHASTATTYGAASASNYGHAMASSTTPKALGTAAVGSETAKFARGDHVHALPALTSCTGTLTVAKGGTGATTATGARENLLIKVSATAPSSPTTGTIWIDIS